ncbi:MAG: transketolase [Planctomycetota bacterium]
MSYDSTIHAKAVELTKLTFEITAAAGSGHPTSGASLAHLVTVLMYEHMRYEPANPAHPASDRLVLSEGHAVPIVYAACADLGVMVGRGKDEWRALTVDEAKTLREIDSLVDGHPNPVEGFPFFDTATGSLGQGLSQATGLGIAARLNGMDKRIFCLIGDGESREGNIWEGVDFLIDHDLKAVCPIFNCNKFAQSTPTGPQQMPDVTQAKLEAVGYDVHRIDGHHPTAIKEALSAHARAQHDPNAAPVAIVADTVKGWGVPSQQGHGHHGAAATGEALVTALAELDATATQVGAAADTPLKRDLMTPSERPNLEPTVAPAFDEACKAYGQEAALEKGRLATRKAFAVALRALGHADPRVVVFDGDVQNSTGADAFSKDAALAERFVQCRIAEQQMVAAAAGLAATNRVPFCVTFGKFLARAYDQVEMAVNSGANLKLVGSHAGITLGADGPSQMAMADVPYFRGIGTMRLKQGQPGFYVLTPSDGWSCYALTQLMAQHDGPAYLRTLRPDTEFLYGPSDTFRLGGMAVLSEGRDLLIVAHGYMVHEANRALELLDQQGIDATLVDAYSLPFDGDTLCDLANENNGMVLTLEDNYGGGLGSAVADALAGSGDGFTLQQMHVTHLPKSGKSPDDLLHYCGLSADHVVHRAMGMLNLTPA